jgi:hypothetical protein
MMMPMPVQDSVRRSVAGTARAAGSATRYAGSGGRRLGQAAARAGRAAGRVRSRLAGGETGMVRLFDLHAISAAGDTLITVGLAGTIFFAVPLGEARGKVALYLLVTMVPFAVLAPLIGPLLDHVRHGRRYALATTMLGRALLALLIADQLHRPALYPAAFGVLVLSRAYGVARAAAVPRLLPARLGLSQVNARGSGYGTLAGLLVLPIGLAAFWIGPQWPLRVSAAIFLVGMVLALRLPASADAEPPAAPQPFPRIWRRRERAGEPVLAGRLVLATVVGSATHRVLYGFLLIFFAFSIRAGQLPTAVGGWTLGEGTALGVVSAALLTGTVVAVAVGSRLRIRRPIGMQAAGFLLAGLVAGAAAAWFTLPLVLLLCLAVAVSSGLAKLAVDSTIQERLPERLRATAFARSETVLMLAFVAGGAAGLVPAPGRLGVGLAAGILLLAVLWTGLVAVRLRGDHLSGRPVPASPGPAPAGCAGRTRAPGDRAPAEGGDDRVRTPRVVGTGNGGQRDPADHGVGE